MASPETHESEYTTALQGHGSQEFGLCSLVRREYTTALRRREQEGRREEDEEAEEGGGGARYSIKKQNLTQVVRKIRVLS